MKLSSQRGYSAQIVFILVVVLGAIFAAGWYVWSSSKTEDKTNTSTTTAATPTPTPAAILKDYKNETYGISLKIPTDWTEQQTPESVILTGKDEANNLAVALTISKETRVALSCSYIIKDSEELAYANPITGQRKTTNLTFTSIGSTSNTLCGVMITGGFAAKKGSMLDMQSSAIQEQLPTNRIVAYVSNADNPTNYPELEKALASTRYKELIAALKTVQVK